MLNVHKKLISVFDSLPLISGLKPHYDWGDSKHFNKLIKLYDNDLTKNIYPVIYNVSNEYSHNENSGEVESRLSLIIATRNTDQQLTNSQRWATSYNNILFPLCQNIITAFTKSAVFYWDQEYDVFEFPNYSEGEENGFTDIIDALRLDTGITITDKCLNKIFYT